MAITRDDVRHTAALARLALSPEEESAFLLELNKILGYVEKIRELDLAGIEPMTHGHAGTGSLRDDAALDGLSQEEALRGAPETDEGHFVVPQVVRPEE
jgi:aspartyl-tRNA(Asn)/glutamyl-tRNA(Gln) amidotransferase subunit C